MSALAWIAAGGLGGLGALARFLVDGTIAGRLGRAFPYGTLVVNATGAFVLGLTVGLALHGDDQVLLGTATIGSYTTFSTWMFETQRLAEDGEVPSAAANILASIFIGVAAAALGRMIGGG